MSSIEFVVITVCIGLRQSYHAVISLGKFAILRLGYTFQVPPINISINVEFLTLSSLDVITEFANANSVMTLLLPNVNILTPRLITSTFFSYFRPDRRQPFPNAPLTYMIIDECRYTCDSHLVNNTELKEKYTYIHNRSNTTELWCTVCANNKKALIKVLSNCRRRCDRWGRSEVDLKLVNLGVEINLRIQLS